MAGGMRDKTAWRLVARGWWRAAGDRARNSATLRNQDSARPFGQQKNPLMASLNYANIQTPDNETRLNQSRGFRPSFSRGWLGLFKNA